MESWLVKQIAELTQRLPGVSVYRIHESDSYCGLDLFITEPVSVARLVRCANSANLETDLMYPFWLSENAPSIDPALLIYRFGHKGEPHPTGCHSPMEVFGIDLVHTLSNSGLLDHDQGETLRDKLNREL